MRGRTSAKVAADRPLRTILRARKTFPDRHNRNRGPLLTMLSRGQEKSKVNNRGIAAATAPGADPA
jgi:hypothetical protein